MARIGQKFVAGERRPLAGMVFYDRPKPYGHWLCRVNAYWVPEKIVTGRLARKQDRWEDDLSVTRRYGIWRRPSAGASSDEARHAACEGFRQFDHTFRADEADPERAAFLLEKAIAAAKADGAPPFPLTCRRWNKHATKPRVCDGKAILRDLSLSELRWAEELSFIRGRDFGSSRDELRVASGDHADGAITLTIASRQHWGRHSISEGEIQSIAVSVDATH